MLPLGAAKGAESFHQDHFRILARGRGTSGEGRRCLVSMVLTTSWPTNAVFRHSANGYHVPWEWWEHGASDTTCKGFLRKDALQCDHGFLSRVSPPSKNAEPISQCTRYGLSEGSPSEEGVCSISRRDLDLTSSSILQASKLMPKPFWIIS